MRTTAYLALALITAATSSQAQSKIWLDDLDLSTMSSENAPAKPRKSVADKPLTIAGKTYERGVGTHAESWYTLEAGGKAIAFEALVGVDDEALVQGRGSVIFQVYADQKLVAETRQMRGRMKPRPLKADLTGADRITLLVTDSGDGNEYDYANWCDAHFTMQEGATLSPSTRPLTEQLGTLTPPTPPAPRINGARIFGLRPNSPLLYTIAASGTRPMHFSASNLPAGLKLNPTTGAISGTLHQPGDHTFNITAKNQHGSITRPLTIRVGNQLALTPPMGWNSWNCFANAVSDKHIRQAADAMVDSGLINHGWSYINIDDFWQTCPGERDDPTLQGEPRDANNNILPNSRFPDMPALADYVHSKGLKIGIYSSPGPLTCGGCIGSWQHEARDIATYAAWGFDYLKYDLCTYSSVAGITLLRDQMRPYILASVELKKQNRDIILSMCQYGMGNVSAWATRAGGNCWRTTLDITDTWESMYEILDAQDGLEIFAGPGGWNDPDMLIVGMVGWGELKPTRLTPNEQITHISMWCLLAAPLMIGCDMTHLDPFTLSLLTNDEVIEVNQDPLGQQARRISHDSVNEVWSKRLSDGSTVVGLLNRSFMTGPVTIDLKHLGLKPPQRIRDLWRQRDEPLLQTNTYTIEVPGHATHLIRLSTP